MSDLISRNELIENFRKCYIGHLGMEKSDSCMTFHGICNVINNTNTSYDIDKVVEELEKSKAIGADCVGEGFECVPLFKAIEIVKQGGVSDDVCEWKSASDGEFIQNPHTKRLYSNEPSMKNVYCNTCGKKIKIVGD